MRKGTWFRSILPVLVLAGAALAAGEADLEQAKKLLAEAEPFAARGDDPDLENPARVEARKEARRLLRAARDAYQKWGAQNPDAEDAVGIEIGKLLHWVNKMSSIAEVSPGGSPGGSSGAPKPPAPPAPPGPGAGPNPPPAPAPPGPVAPQPPAAPDPAQIARDDFAKMLEFEKSNRTDPGAVKDAWERFLTEHPDPALPEYAKAAERVGKLQEELNATFKRVVGQDPDAIENVDSKAIPVVMSRLKRDLSTRDPELRRKAARLLGMTRSGAASYVLIVVLRDDDEELARIAQESLISIGGTRTCESLTKQYRNSAQPAQMAALAVLEGIARKGPVDARTASFWIGRFVCSPDDTVAKRALDFLVSLGKDGGPGLVESLESKVAEKRLAAIDALGSVGYVKATRRLCAFLLRGDGEAVETYRARAQRTIKSFGIPAVPHMIAALGDGRQKAWVGVTLREMTGAMISDDNPKAWREWYETNKDRK